MPNSGDSFKGKDAGGKLSHWSQEQHENAMALAFDKMKLLL